MDEADDALVALWEDIRESKTPLKLRQDLMETLTSLRRHLAAYRWTEGDRRKTAIIGSRLILPPDAGQVVLDATGALNGVYLGRKDVYHIEDMPSVRDYRNVTLLVARTNGTGKDAMSRRGDEIAQQTLKAVLEYYADASARRVLVVTDKASEEKVRQIFSQGGFAAMDVAHWNKIDGRNDWTDYDTLVALTLPWARASLDIANYTAIHGVELDDDGLNTPPDDVRRLREARVAAGLAQAIGRIRLRRMIHEDGSCEPCDVFVRVPNFKVVANGAGIIKGVERALVGIRACATFANFIN